MKTTLFPILTLICLSGLARAYVLHEWGTFTTVSGSDGVLLPGLEREEEALPFFTYSHFGLQNGNALTDRDPVTTMNQMPPQLFLTKGMRRPVRGVTVKMETPVIYFYSDHAFDVKAKVDFVGGTISQWYPDRSAGEILPVPVKGVEEAGPEELEKWTVDFTRPRRGSISWDARVLSPAETRDAILFKPGESLHWARPRVPSANAVRTGKGETEGFLFYRGIGAFQPGLITTAAEDGTLTLKNLTGGDLPFLLVYEKSAAGTRWRMLDGLGADNSVDVPEASLALTTNAFPEEVYRSLVQGLEGAGLFREEAKAMVETWWDSYFARDGLRIFWVLPTAKTAAILPLEVSPAPEKTVRVLVGRSEVLRPGLEREWLAQSRSEDPKLAELWADFVGRDRFGLAYRDRIAALAATAER